MTDRRPASEIISDLQPNIPVKPASDMLDAERMRAEGVHQEQERQRIIDQANSGGGPSLR